MTAVREAHEGEGEGRAKALRGGQVYQAGSTNVLGTFCPAFKPVMGLDEVMVKQVISASQRQFLIARYYSICGCYYVG